jgi:hypothetical protein
MPSILLLILFSPSETEKLKLLHWWWKGIHTSEYENLGEKCCHATHLGSYDVT